MWCDVASLPSSHPLVWVTGEVERDLVLWTAYIYSGKTQTVTTHTHTRRVVLQVWQCLFDVCCYHVRNEPAIINVSGWCKLICVMGRVPGFAFREKKAVCSSPSLQRCKHQSLPSLYSFFLKEPPTPRSLLAWKSLIHQYFDFWTWRLSITIASFLPSE